MRSNAVARGVPLRAFALVGVLCGTSIGGPITYTVLDLHPAGASGLSIASAINESGQVAASVVYFGPDGEHQYASAYRTAPNRPIDPSTDDLGSLGQPFTYATGINERGQVIGSDSPTAVIYIGPDGTTPTHTFRTAPNQAINPATDDLGSFGGTWSTASGINDSGWVVGTSTTTNGTFRAFLAPPDGPIDPATSDLGTLGGTSAQAGGINNLGQVVGSSRTASGGSQAFRTAPYSPIDPASDGLGLLPGPQPYTQAYDLNELGQVVGRARISDFPNYVVHPFLFSGDTMIDLGTFGGGISEAFAINNHGSIVGASQTVDGISHAFLFLDGSMLDLNDLIEPESDWLLQYAWDINDRGQIVGSGLINGESHAFLLTPVPEPATLGLLLLASAVAASRRREIRWDRQLIVCASAPGPRKIIL